VKIVHVITGLAAHGAETMLYRFLAASDAREYQHEVISLTDRGDLAGQIESLGVPVGTLGMRPGIPNPLAIRKLASMLRQSQPDLVQTWMYHADLVGGLAAHFAGNTPVIWGIHHTRVDWRETKFFTLLTVRVCAWLSHRLPAAIVCCSHASKKAHVAMGYNAAKMTVIPNAIDVEAFGPDPAAGITIREELGIPANAQVIGLAARFHPHKDHQTFFQAAELLRQDFPEVHFVLCGDGVTEQNLDVRAMRDAAKLAGRCHLLGARNDMRAMFAAWDIATNSSLSEALPLAVGEAMACQVPCVVTAVGDCPLVVGDTGIIVEPQQPELLAGAWREMLKSNAAVRKQMGIAARQRIVKNYSLPALVEQYQALYRPTALATRHSNTSQKMSAIPQHSRQVAKPASDAALAVAAIPHPYGEDR
jgi:glycosyltransferase involved in cell wall biosynthesis